MRAPLDAAARGPLAALALALAALAPAAGCAGSGDGVFSVRGIAEVGLPRRGQVVALWEIKAPPPARFFKFGEGRRINAQFSLAWDADPPPEALNASGIGVAIFVLLPEDTVVPDGEITLRELPIQGISGDTAVVYKPADATGPAWSEALPLRFSCARCVRSPVGTTDAYELAPCAAMTLEAPAAARCNW